MKSDGDGHAPFWGPVPALVAGLLVVDLLFAIAFVLVEAAGRTFMSLFDLDSDASLPTWYSSIKLFLIASLVGLYALSRFDRGRPRSWILLSFPIVFLLMSADEVVMVHEQIGRKLDVLLPSGAREESWFRASGIWMIVIGLPFLFVSSACSGCRYRTSSKRDPLWPSSGSECCFSSWVHWVWKLCRIFRIVTHGGWYLRSWSKKPARCLVQRSWSGGRRAGR